MLGRSSPASSVYAASFIVSRFRHLALIRITLGMGFFKRGSEQRKLAHRCADGLQGVKMWPIFNKFRFDLYG